MSLPIMRSTPTYMLNITKLSGGLNLRDGLSQVADNQLTDCVNMWFKDGTLKTRPRLMTNDNTNKLHTSDNEGGLVRTLGIRVRSFPECVIVVNNEVYTLQVVMEAKTTHNDDISNTFTMQYVSDRLEVIELGKFTITTDRIVHNCLVFQHNGNVYLFTASYKPHYWVIKQNESGEYEQPAELTEEDMKAPLVAINGKPSEDTVFTGTMINGYNLLSRYYEMQYSTVDKAKESNTMRYALIHPIQKSSKDGIPYDYAVGKKIKAEYTTIDGHTHKHEVVIGNNGEGYETKPGTDGYTMHVWRQEVYFWKEDNDSGDYAVVEKGDYIPNNLTVTAPGPYSFEREMKVVSMTHSVWFGGMAEGIYGGTRLFLGGNPNKNEQALVVWSDLNDPLYFSENNYTYVGDKSQAITTFGKQADTLVIFKERETYQTKYVAKESPTAEQVINQNVIDLTVQSATFPLSLVHGYIGCDCPDTVALCRNRLVWTNLNGKVYTLQSQNQYNERAIFEVGEMIEQRLKNEQYLYNARAVDFNGHYILQIGNHLYVMDYNSYGYIYVSSHAKNEDANIKIPWYYWELPMAVEDMHSTIDRLIMVYCVATEPDENLVSHSAINFAYIDGSDGSDEINKLIYNGDWEIRCDTLKIPSYMQTKLYNFGAPSKLKAVPIVNISFGYNNGEPIKIEFISECDIHDEHSVVVEGFETDERNPQHIHSCRLFPYTKGTVMFGVKISCNGEMSIDSMTLQYKQLGGAK